MSKGKQRRKTSRPAAAPNRIPTAASAIEGVVWPALGDINANAVLAVYYQLQQSEWYAPDVLARQQWRQLQELVAAAANTPYYAPLLGKIGYDPQAPLHERVWREMPLLSRQTLQQHGELLLNAQAPASLMDTLTFKTSGSTGMPVEIRWPKVLRIYQLASILREQMWHRRDLNGREAYLRVFKDLPAAQAYPGARAQGWRTMDRIITTAGESFALDVHTPLEDQLRWLEAIDVHYLSTYPSNLKALIGLASARGRELRLPSLREIRLMSESVSDELRKLVAETLAVPLVDAYSTQEVGHIAYQCPDVPNVYHVLSELVKVEVIRDDGSACAVGETGRVVLTALHNLRMPLLRYDIGDYAEVGAACPCGRGLPVLNRILGRSRGMLVYPDGRRRWPLAGDGDYRRIAPIVQYQYVQKTPHSLDVNLVAERPLTADESAAFTHWVQAQLDYPFELNIHYFNTIPRHASGKFEDFRNDIPDDYQNRSQNYSPQR